MTNLADFENDLILLAEKRNELSRLSYSDTLYEDVEDMLHDMEDDFNEKYGNMIEEALYEIHDEYCPDNDVLLPTAYLAKKYLVSGTNANTEYDVTSKDGVIVDADDYPDQLVRMVLIPNPARIVMLIGNKERKEVWVAKNQYT
jgi:hypothetical protein